MTEFASRTNSPAEQTAIYNAIVETFDATLVITGLERARQLAQQAKDLGAVKSTSLDGGPVPTIAPEKLWEDE